ncbi:MAG: response regulator [Chitinophagaceae bacterium]
MKKLLIIDDHDEIRENIAEILSLSGYKTFTEKNGKKGLESAIKNKPDLIICDIMMPELDGYGVLHLLKRNTETQNIPFIFITAKTERQDFRKGMEMGADDYITKPFDEVELLKAVEVRLKKLDLLEQKYPPDQSGINKMMHDLLDGGYLELKLDDYETLQLSKKQVLFSEGKRPYYLYFLIHGKIKGERIHQDGKEYISNLYGSGDFLGYLPLLEGQNYEESAAALEDSTLILIPKEEFLGAVYGDILITRKFIQLIAQNIQGKEDRLLELAYGSLRKRIAKALLEIQAKFSGNSSSQQPIEISREDIAHYVGTATESLIRNLSEFKAENLIQIKEGKITILDPVKLKNLLY